MKVALREVLAAERKANAAELAVERFQARAGYGRSNEKARELKNKAQRLRGEFSALQSQYAKQSFN